MEDKFDNIENVNSSEAQDDLEINDTDLTETELSEIQDNVIRDTDVMSSEEISFDEPLSDDYVSEIDLDNIEDVNLGDDFTAQPKSRREIHRGKPVKKAKKKADKVNKPEAKEKDNDDISVISLAKEDIADEVDTKTYILSLQKDNPSNKRSIWLNIIAFVIPLLGVFWCFYYLLKAPERSKSMLKVVIVSLILQFSFILFGYLCLFDYLGSLCITIFG